MLKAFKAFDTTGMQGKDIASLGAHTMLREASNMGWGSATAWGAGGGAVYGGIEGALSYDGSFMSGAVHGAMVGAAGGAGFRAASGLYAKSAGGQVADINGRFAWKNFADGWSTTK